MTRAVAILILAFCVTWAVTALATGPIESGSVDLSPGACTDADGNGKCEIYVLGDSDGDGSGWVTCTAKDTPASECKIAGERIWQDFADDYNHAVHYKLEDLGGTIKLQGGIYSVFPCWNAASPNHSPTDTDSTNHDSKLDAAYADCPVHPDTGEGMWVLQNGAKDIIIEGVGEDGRSNDTTELVTRGEGRVQGTTIAQNMGPYNGTWFGGTPASIRTTSWGLKGGTAASNPGGNSMAGGDSKGFGLIVNTEVPSSDGTYCVCDQVACGTADPAGWAQTLATGDRMWFSANSDRSASIVTILAQNGQGGCAANQIELELGGQSAIQPSPTSDAFHHHNPVPMIDTTGALLYHMRSDWMNSKVTMRNVTWEPQDYYNEAGGDCATTGSWVDDATDLNDYDCDTMQFWLIGEAKFRTEKVTMKRWHAISVDSQVTAGAGVVLNDIDWYRGNGHSISDMGSNWKLQNSTVRDSYFGSGGFVGTYGNNLTIENMVFENVVGDYFVNLTDNRHQRIRNIEIRSSAFRKLLLAGCGGQFNYVQNVRMTGWTDGGISNSPKVLLASMDCQVGGAGAGFSNNVVSDVWIDAPAATPSTITNDMNALIWARNYDLNTGNLFQNINYIDNRTGATAPVAMACVRDLAPLGDRLEEAFWARNTFTNNTLALQPGQTGLMFALSGFGGTAQGVISSAGTVVCDDLPAGAIGGYEDANGCQNQVMDITTGLYTQSALNSCEDVKTVAAASVAPCDPTPTATELGPGTVVKITDDTAANACTQGAGPPYSLSGGGAVTSFCQCTSATGWAGF